MVKDALALYIFDIEEEHLGIPTPSNPTTIKLEKNQFISIIDFDMIK